MFYIVTLGNQGEEYKNTRHNLGWLVADYIADKVDATKTVHDSYLEGNLRTGEINKQGVTIFYPATMMNNSGRAVKKLVKKEEVAQLIVIHDDIALPFTEIKVSFDRGAGGHNGVDSLIKHLGTKSFLRIRLGLAPRSFITGKTKVITGEKYARFVLGRFSSSEKKQIPEVAEKVLSALSLVVYEGKEKAMNQFN
jgi:peptidyl-tRNA hydrolase, PTH1 family